MVVVPRGHLLSLRSVRLKRPMILNVFGVYDNANNQPDVDPRLQEA
jgi:hypothetical protein